MRIQRAHDGAALTHGPWAYTGRPAAGPGTGPRDRGLSSETTFASLDNVLIATR